MKYYKENNFIFFRNDKNNKLFINAKGDVTFRDFKINIKSDEIDNKIKNIIDQIKYKFNITKFDISYSIYTWNSMYSKILNNNTKSINADKYTLEYIFKHCKHELLICVEKYDIENNILHLRLSKVIGDFDEKINDHYVRLVMSKFNQNKKVGIEFGNKFMNKRELFMELDKIF